MEKTSIKNKYVILSFISAFFLTVFISPHSAFAATYYFNNAVNQSPTEQGNYWDDAGLSAQSISLPDFSVDEVYVVGGSIFNNSGLDDIIFNGSATNSGTITGNAIFNGGGTNSGTITGNATFNETTTNSAIVTGNAIFNNDSANDGGVVTGNASFYDSSLNSGTVSGNLTCYGDLSYGGGNPAVGIQTRYYTDPITTVRTFTPDDNGKGWTVVADGVQVDISGATIDNLTTLSAINGGSFIYPLPIIISFSISGFATSIDQGTHTITLNPYSYGASVTALSPTVNDNSFSVSPNSGASQDFTNPVIYTVTSFDNVTTQEYTITILPQTATPFISIQGSPRFILAVGSKIYTIQQNQISVIDSTTDTVVDTIFSGGSTFFYASTIGTKLYVNDAGTDTVYVIDTISDSIIDTIPVGGSSYYSSVVGTKLYVLNSGSNSVSVIDTNTDTVVDTIVVEDIPFNSSIVGTKLYVLNSGISSVSVIDTNTDTVVDTITVGNNPVFSSVLGDKLYVDNQNDGTISVIDTNTDTVVDTITVESLPRRSAVVGTKLYVLNTGSDTVSVIDTNTDTVIDTLSVGHYPYDISLIGTNLFILNENTNTISVIDTNTDTVVDTIVVGNQPIYSTFTGTKLYIFAVDNTVSIVNTKTIESLRPNLTSFTSTTPSGTYTPGQSINI
ncbi:MAG: hypothetical protein V4504_02345, partial [Patescibacteria group bacterium]